MAREPRPVFLERRNYRRRRMMDAVKIVAILGAILWLIPVIWPNGDDPNTEPMPMSGALSYVFGVWLFLILLSAGLSRVLSDAQGSEAEAQQDPEREQ